MKVSEKGRELIQRYEGFCAEPYRCPGGFWTIGYGHRMDSVQYGRKITRDEAVELLCADVLETEEFLNLIGCVCVLSACGVRKQEVREREGFSGNESIRVSEIRSGERLTERDAVVNVRAPVEESRNLAEDSSFVKTSLAWSVAVWKDGKLWHSICNFPVISSPVRTVERERWQILRDTLIVRDTVRVKEIMNREVVKAPSFLDRWRGMLGIIVIIIIAGYCAWRKLKLR